MYSKILTQTGLDTLVTLDEVKRQTRMVGLNHEDDYLTSLIPVAADLAQSYSRRMFTAGTAVTVVEQYCDEVQLPFGNVDAVTLVEFDGEAGTSEDFEFDDITQKVTFSRSGWSKARIEYSVVDMSTAELNTVKQGVLMLISTMFGNREDVVIGVSVEKMPLSSKKILDRVRFYVS